STSMWMQFQNFPAYQPPPCKTRSNAFESKTSSITTALQTRRCARLRLHTRSFAGKAVWNGVAPSMRFDKRGDPRWLALRVSNGSAGNSDIRGGNGHKSGEGRKSTPSLRYDGAKRHRSASSNSYNGWLTSNSTAVVRKAASGACRSGSISILRLEFA